MMNVIYYPSEQGIQQAMQEDEPLLMLISHNQEQVICPAIIKL